MYQPGIGSHFSVNHAAVYTVNATGILLKQKEEASALIVVCSFESSPNPCGMLPSIGYHTNSRERPSPWVDTGIHLNISVSVVRCVFLFEQAV